MKTIWYVAKKDLLQTIRDRSSIFFILIMPIIFITVMGLTLGNAFGNSGAIQVTVAMNNQDDGFVGQNIAKYLNINTKTLQLNLKNYSTADQVTTAVADTKSGVDAGVVIPAGATDALLKDVENHQPTNNLIKFYSLPGTNNQPTLIAQQILNTIISSMVTSEYAGNAAVQQVNQVCNAAGNHCAPATINPQTISQAVGQAVGAAAQTSPVEALTAGQVVKVSSFDLYVPGYAIFFALFSINSVAGSILQEKEDGTFRRLLIAPIRKYSLLGGKLLAQFILTTLQMLILFAFGYIFFHIHINNPLAVGLLILGTSFGVTGLGILLVSIVKSRRQLNPVVTIVTLVSSVISGIFFPSWLLPSWLQQFSHITLPAWAAEGLNNVMIYGKDLNYVLPDILGLFAYGLICYIIALRLFRFQAKTA
ncbi:MAG TPA: ABC transporter permease [Ktedonobacteraceae bacterium]